MSTFDQAKKVFTINPHAVKRMYQRNKVPFSQAEEKCYESIHNGKLLLETDKYRYIKNGNLFLPCKKDGNTYELKTILLWDTMVEKRFQNVIDNYHSNTSR